MNGSDIMHTADQLLRQYGVIAKREATRHLLLALSDDDSTSAKFWRSVINCLLDDEAKNPRLYDHLLSDDSGAGDLLTQKLRAASVQHRLSTNHALYDLSQTCDIAATYIGALEDALRKLLKEGSAARSAAIRVLIEGPLKE